jgi:hypothetical protein
VASTALIIHCPKQQCSGIYISNYIKYWLTSGKYSMKILTGGGKKTKQEQKQQKREIYGPSFVRPRHTY